MDVQRVEHGKGRVVVIATAVLLLLVIGGIGIYWLTGPHTALEAVAKSPVVGEQANYELDGEIELQAEVTGMRSLPKANIPYKLTVAGNRTYLELFSPGSSRDGDPVFETYLVPEKGGFSHYDRGSVLEAVEVLAALVSFTGVESAADLAVMLGIPDPASVSISAADALGAIGNAKLAKGADGYDVIMDGQGIVDLVYGQAASDNASIVPEMLSSSELIISYDGQGEPVFLLLRDAEASRSIDLGIFGQLEMRMEIGASGEFCRVGEVSAEETAVPDELL